MNPQNAISKRHIFDSFCKKILRNELRDYYDEVNRLGQKEAAFSELSAHELNQLFTTDDYFAAEHIFNVQGQDIVVIGDSIAEALKSLPERKRDIILLSYFLEMTDREIGEKLNLIRATVQYQRKITLRELKQFFEGGQADE